MHFVFVTSLVPDGDPATGYEIANAAIIGALRRLGARVTVLGCTWPGKAPSDPENTVSLGEIDVRTEGAPASRKIRWLAGAVMSGLTFASAKLRAVGEGEVRSALERIGPFDAYVLNAVQFAGAFETLFTDKPSIFVAHNVEHVSAEENAAAVQDLFQRALFRREARILKAVEERLCRRARFVFTLSEEDRVALGVGSDDRSAALPLVTRAEAPRFGGTRATECDAALIGTWTWQPNRIGLDWFLGEVAPRLRPGFRTRIAGHIPAGLGAVPAGVELVGRVPDAVDFVRSGRVIPLIARAGTGVQLKTIEAFELGLPTVATTASLRGIGARPENCVVADDPEEFAERLQAAVDGAARDVDGAGFHRQQLDLLDRRVARGLESLRPALRGAAA